MEEGKMKLYMNILKYAVGGIGFIACVWVLMAGGSFDLELQADKEAFMNSSAMGMAISYTVGIIVAAIVGVLLFFVFQLITNSKKTVMSILGIIVALVIYLIFRMIGTTDTNASLQLAEANHVDDATLASSTAGLYTVLFGIAVATIVALLGPFLLGKYRK